jgi:hypothetical protein
MCCDRRYWTGAEGEKTDPETQIAGQVTSHPVRPPVETPQKPCVRAPPVQRRRGTAHAYRGVSPGIPDRRVTPRALMCRIARPATPPDMSPEDGTRHAASDPRTVRLRLGHRHCLDPRHASALPDPIWARSGGDCHSRTRTRRAGGHRRTRHQLHRPCTYGRGAGRVVLDAQRCCPLPRPRTARCGGDAHHGGTGSSLLSTPHGRTVPASLTLRAC